MGMNVRLGLKVYLNVGAVVVVVVVSRFCMGWEFGRSVLKDRGEFCKEMGRDRTLWRS